MPITPNNLKRYLTGGSSNTNPNNSLGGARSNTQVGTGNNNLWDNISSSETSSNRTEYRCEMIRNEHATLAWQAPRIYISQDNTNANITIAIGKSNQTQGSTPDQISFETTTPPGVTFSSPMTYSAAATNLSHSDVAARAFIAYWTRRTMTRNADASSDNYTITARGETAA